MKFKVVNFSADELSSETLSLKSQSSEHHIYLTLNKQSKDKRLVNASTKSRGKVSGGGSKPYRQKGTGNARQGTRRSPNTGWWCYFWTYSKIASL